MKLFKYSKIPLGLLLGALASVTSVLGNPKFVSEWATEIRSVAASRNFKIEAPEQLEQILISEINLDNFDASCSVILQKIIKETGFESSPLNLESALDICAVINPWNSMECSGITGVTASYARSLQEFVRVRDSKSGDLRAACLVASAIAPGRPFTPLIKGSIKSKCQEVCSGVLSKTISAIDPSFCSLTIDLCSSVDFSLYSAFSSFNERELGVAVAVSVLLSEGSVGLRTSFREGCRFVLFLKNKGIFPNTSSEVSEPEFFSSISEFYRAKLIESGLLPASGANPKSTDAVFLRVMNSQIVKATKSILEAQIPRKQADVRPKKQAIASTHITSSEVSPLSETSDFSSEIKVRSRPSVEEGRASGSPVLESWFNTIKQSIKRGTKDIDHEFDDSLNKAIAHIDSSSVYFSCVSELKRFSLGSHRRITEACRKIDPFSHVKCQKLNHFELVAMIKLREELEKHSKEIVVDLRDLCAVAPKMSFESFLRTRDEELSSICIRTLRKSAFKSKYPFSERAIKKACIKADYFRNSSCGNLVSSYSEKVNLVLSLANYMFNKKTDKERLQIVRESEFSTPSYADICNSVERIPVETVEECIFELRDSLSKFKSIASLIDIEGACIASLEEFPFGHYPHHLGGLYDHYPHSIYPEHLHPAIPKKSIRRFYKDIEFQQPISSFQWYRAELPATLEQRAPFLETEYSESRRGFYKEQDGKPAYHDGYRYRLNGSWYVKVGDNWYIDNSSSLDFIRISPGDPRYTNYPLSLYEKSPSDSKGLLRRKSFATYLSPHSPYYLPRRHYLDTFYGRHRVGGYHPTHEDQPFYRKCEKCYNWIPYGHHHEHEKEHGHSSSRFVEKLPSVKKGSSYVTITNEYDDNGKIIVKRVDMTSQPEQNPPEGKREVGVQVDTIH
ncbi:uncharacterized protein ELE39_000839 [Cryptosporidium sp. chipmunk genotype I]|uniref:uncharacterized protein n=1 Tax=Cryptosporidium sp. chipmunk genotype I TaxID=1280935 RepID=UPI00351A2026|nr:hypothetical protein ELE39_000839 [Cryptosporidium sp. chipmunk genotype I]